MYETFRYEIDAMRKHFPVRYFSPHGGWTDELGRGNASFNYPQHVDCGAKWVHNRFSPKFHGYYSDGGPMSRIRRNDPTVDLMTWLATLQPGQRYRMLIHPQYFSRKTFVPLEGIEAEWYGRVLATAETGRWI